MAFSFSKVNAQFTADGIDGNPSEWKVSNINSIPIHAFIHDAFGNGVVDSQFTGSKDFFFGADQRWSVSQTKPKNDIANAAAVLTPDGKLFFAGDRTSNNGDAQIGFWFYLNGTAPHVRADGTQDFEPEHAIGDLLILADFTGGGNKATVTVLTWVETGGDVPNTNGRLHTTNISGIVAENNSGTAAVPEGWIFTSNSFATNEFYEGVVDLTGLNLPSLCFSSFLLETRSSQSITASLDDFASASFNARPHTPTVTGAERCGAGTLTLTASCSGSGVHWFTNAQGGAPLGQADGVSADGNSLTRNFNSTQTFFVSCFNASINCESDRVPVTGTVNPPATVNAGVDQTVCASSPQVTLAGVVGGSATSGTWSGGTGTFNPNANTLNAIYTPSATEIAAGFVELTLTTNDPAGACPAVSDVVRININPAATVNAGVDQTVCASSPQVTLAGVVGGGATSGTWSGGTGTFNPNANTLNAVYTPSAAEIAAGFVDLTLTTNDPAGPCAAVSDNMRININPPATVNAGADQTVCASSPQVTLAGVVGGSATSGTWSGGTGTFNPNANTLNAVYTPSATEIAAGFVDLTLTTNDPAGPCPAVSDLVRIIINPVATVNAGADQTVCASSPQVTLAGVVGGSATSGTWSGGTGTFSPNANTLNAVYTPSAAEITAGFVDLTLTTNDPAGPCPAVSDVVRITFNPAATVNAGDDQTVCANSPQVTLAGVVGGSATSGTWSGGTGTFNPNANTLNAVYTPSAAEIAAGFVELTLTTNDPAGPCPAVSDKVRININPAATVNAGADQTVCSASPTVTLAGVVGGSATSGTWSGGTGTFNPNANTLNAVYTLSAAEVAAGFVELTLTTNDPAGPCPAVSDKVKIIVTTNATANAGADQEVCASSPSVTLAGVVGGGATSGTWSGGTGTFNPNANTLNAVYTPSAAEIAAGFVELTLTTNDPDGPCNPATDVMRITIHPNPVLVFSNLVKPTCAGNNAGIDITINNGTAPFNIFFDGNLIAANTSNAIQISFPADGNDHIVKVIDAKGCEGQGTVNGVTAPSPIVFTLTTKVETCAGSNQGCVIVNISGGTPPYKVQLNNGALVQLGANETSHQFCNLAPGVYSVHVTDVNNCPVNDQSITLIEGPQCAPLPTGHCTYTQGQYGTFNGQACLPGGSSVLAGVIMTKALQAEPNHFRDFGVVANNKFFRLTLDDVTGDQTANIYKLLPGGGNACELKGFATFSQQSTWPNVPLSTKPQTFGKILNTLLAQTITMYFNLSEDPTLGSEVVQDTIITNSQTFCGSGVAQPGTEQKFGFPHSVVVFLNNSSDGFDYPNTYAGLFKLANDILGGVNVPVNCADVASAVDVLNNAFDGCRIQTGSIPFNNSSSLIVSNSIQRATVEKTAIENPGELKVNAYPNPFSDKINFNFVSPVRGMATLEIFNLAGQKIVSLFSGMIEAGIPQTVQYVKGKSISNSMLIYKLTVGTKSVYGKIQVMK